jgi:hypothetical protein
MVSGTQAAMERGHDNKQAVNGKARGECRRPLTTPAWEGRSQKTKETMNMGQQQQTQWRLGMENLRGKTTNQHHRRANRDVRFKLIKTDFIMER